MAVNAQAPRGDRFVPAPAGAVVLGGVLGEAIEASRRGRLGHFITGPDSPAIAIFHPEHTRENLEGDWYGEHAGKWLYAAARAVARSGDVDLRDNLRAVADYLLSRQADDGYLGNYAPERRFMRPQPPKPVSWDGAPAWRTWDIWTHSYLILGLIETWRALGDERYLAAAQRIGDLCWRTLGEGGIDITSLGNHFGMSATVLMDPAVELHLATGDLRYLELAERIAGQADAEPRLGLIRRALEGADASEIATGKAYQLAWNLVGLAKLHRATGKARYRDAVDHLWCNIRDHHLTLGGGPWGGVAHRSREVFNPAGVFSPQAYVETCSVLAWLQLNRELLRITGHTRHAEEIERIAYNDLLGAAAPNGEDWCYYSFPNGPRVHTTYWRCCKSSGAMAWEELPPLAYGVAEDGALQVNLYAPGQVRLALPKGEVGIVQSGGYPFADDVTLTLQPAQAMRFTLRLRVPAWTEGARVTVNGEVLDAGIAPGEWLDISRDWQPGDVVALRLPMTPTLHLRRSRNVQESRAPDGSPVRQQVLRYDYVGLTRGPLVYATGLIDGFKHEEAVRLPDAPPARWLRELAAADGGPGMDVEMQLDGRAPLRFAPYYRAGGREDGAWRLGWLSLAPDPAAWADPPDAGRAME
ncbi:beta-L-arabinofuranosidase domain-containing protein [Pseudoxanthomonas sp. PXM04]|uniref:glycoside hydrolase family 127 protein n=1 Tax=Pseudoxanthomonas sp. PXM04 TaxID=2769297 RepID=UPI001CE21E45|nr:beta-L-arabinofuranosidase domain-containing protein [Pseudoxanthomonas sp. PXM04]